MRSPLSQTPLWNCCTISYTDTKSPQYVSSYAVVDLGGGIIRQQFHNGVCDSGERIVAYFDCAAGTGAWLGGPINAPGLPQPPPDATGYVAPILGEGVDGAFIGREEPRLADGPHPEAVLARAQRLPRPHPHPKSARHIRWHRAVAAASPGR